MTETLDQQEIDALLSAVEEQDAFEQDGAVQIFSRHRRESEPIEIREYDFKRPERIAKEQVRALETLHESFARSFSASLSGFLRMITEVSVAQVEQMTYAEFISGLPSPTCFNLIESRGLDGLLGLEISPLIIYPIIDRLLGGGDHDLFIPQRPLTVIESRLVRQILTRAATCLTEAWEGFAKTTFTLGEMETNPHLVQFLPSNEIVVVVRFELKMNKRAGTMSLCIPFKLIEVTMTEISSRNLFGSRTAAAGKSWQPVIAARLEDAMINVSAILAETTMTVRDLQNLEVGDVVVTTKSAREAATLSIEGRPKFRANLGQHRGNRAVQVAGPLEDGGE